MLYDFLQVTDELMDSRSKALAKALNGRTRKTYSQGDALHLILRLERWVVREASEDAQDMEAELLRCSTFAPAAILPALELATDWPEERAQVLLDALSDPTVKVLEAVEGGWRVRGLAERYGRFAGKRTDARGRAKASRLAKKHGFKPQDDGTWEHPNTGESLKNWEEVLAKLGGQQTHGGPDAQA